MPAFLAGSLFAYEDLLGVFTGRIVVRPPTNDLPLNTVALTSERLIAFDLQGATEASVAVPLSAVTGISSSEDATDGRVSVISASTEVHVAGLTPADAAFTQSIVYHAAAGRLYRVGQPETSEA
jgi:hypothetical protein